MNYLKKIFFGKIDGQLYGRPKSAVRVQIKKIFRLYGTRRNIMILE